MTVEQATVTIDGTDFTTDWDGSSAVALATIDIHWGRRDLYEDTPPTEFTVALLDPTGLYATDNSLSGKTVVVTRPGGTVVRGTIGEIESTMVKVTNPDSGAQVRVWIVVLYAACKIADLAQSRPANLQAVSYGDGTPIPGGWWRPETLANRLGQLFTYGGAGEIVDSVATPNVAVLGLTPPASTDTAVMHQHFAYENLSLLDIIEEVYASVPLGHVNYDPATNGIVVGLSAETGGFQLTLSGSTIVMSPIAGLSVPAVDVETPDGITVRSTIAYGIDEVQTHYVHSTNGGEPWDDLIMAASTARASSSNTQRVLTVKTWFRDNYSGQGSYGDLWAAAVAAKTVELVDDVNDRFSPPMLRFDLRRVAYDPALLDVLLDSKSHAVPIYFAGAATADLPNYPGQFQIIGGRLRWVAGDEGSTFGAGWVLDATLAPATGNTTPESIAGLVTLGTPALTDYSDDITLYDLGLVTVGLD